MMSVAASEGERLDLDADMATGTACRRRRKPADGSTGPPSLPSYDGGYDIAPVNPDPPA
jgi:hypothetical protein